MNGESGWDGAAWRRGGVLDSPPCTPEVVAEMRALIPVLVREEKEGMMSGWDGAAWRRGGGAGQPRGCAESSLMSFYTL